jgi:hypothetical protein
MVPKNISYDFNLHTSRIFMNRLAIGMSTHRLYSQIFNVLFFPNLPYFSLLNIIPNCLIRAVLSGHSIPPNSDIFARIERAPPYRARSASSPSLCFPST